MFRKLTNLVNEFLRLCLGILNFPGSAYVNLWSASLLIISIWVCITTKSIPMPVSMIFSSIIVAYGAHKVSLNLSGKGQDNDNNNGNDGSN